jgi:hypothetical protein
MQADRVEVSWDSQKSKWVVRIQTGEEVIRRQTNLPKSADEQALRKAATDTLKDEGYEADASRITVQRMAS